AHTHQHAHDHPHTYPHSHHHAHAHADHDSDQHAHEHADQHADSHEHARGRRHADPDSDDGCASPEHSDRVGVGTADVRSAAGRARVSPLEEPFFSGLLATEALTARGSRNPPG